MALETGTYVNDLVATNPAATDALSAADDHIRLIKSTIKASLPNVSGAITSSHTELNALTGVTASPTEINKLDGLTATTAQKNTLATGAAVPSGGIIMWSGAVSAIPTGWVLCNGSNSTPDLRNRFVLGAGSTYAVNATGGATTDSVTTDSAGSHSHGGTTGNDGVTIPRDGWGAGGSFGTSTSGRLVSGRGSQEFGETLESITHVTGDRTFAHTHTISTEAAHTHTATVDILPPYYALAYIMKS